MKRGEGTFFEFTGRYKCCHCHLSRTVYLGTLTVRHFQGLIKSGDCLAVIGTLEG